MYANLSRNANSVAQFHAMDPPHIDERDEDSLDSQSGDEASKVELILRHSSDLRALAAAGEPAACFQHPDRPATFESTRDAKRFCVRCAFIHEMLKLSPTTKAF